MGTDEEGAEIGMSSGVLSTDELELVAGSLEGWS
jgi:hypothetical protein